MAHESGERTPTPRGRRLRTLVRIALVLSAMLIAVVVALLQRFPAEAFRPWLEEILTEQLGRPVTIEKLELAPLRGFELTRARVASAVEGEAADLTVDFLRFEFGIWDLLQGEVRVRALVGKGIEITARESGGRWNWDLSDGTAAQARPGQSPASAPSGKPLELPVEIEELNFTGVRVRVVTPELDLAVGTFGLFAQGRVGRGRRLFARLSAEPDAQLDAAMRRGTALTSALLGLSGKLEAEIAGGEELTVTTGWQASLLRVAEDDKELRLPTPLEISARCKGSLSRDTYGCESLQVKAGKALEVDSAGELSLSPELRADWQVPRAIADLGEAASILSQLTSERLELSGTLEAKELKLLVSGADTTMSGNVNLKVAKGRYGELSMGQTDASVSVETLALDANGMPASVGRANISARWSSVGWGKLVQSRKGSAALSARADGNQTEWKLEHASQVRFDGNGIAHDGTISLGALGHLDLRQGLLRIERAQARAAGIELSGDGEFEVAMGARAKGGREIAHADLRVNLEELLAGWLREAGNPSALERVGLAGILQLGVIAERASGDAPLALAADFRSGVATNLQESFVIETGRVEGVASTTLLPGQSDLIVDATMDVSAASMGAAGYLALLPKLHIEASTDTGAAGLITASLGLSVAGIAAQGQEEQLVSPDPLEIKGRVEVDRGKELATWLNIDMNWGKALGANLSGKGFPRSRTIDLRARSGGRWDLQGLLVRMPAEVRRQFRDGKLGGSVAFEASAKGVIPERFQSDKPLPLLVDVRADWRDISGELIEQEVGLGDASGSVRCATARASGPIECTGWTQMRETIVAAFPNPRTGPTVMGFEMEAPTLSRISLKDFRLYNDRFHTGVHLRGEYLPRARPPVLSIDINTLTSATGLAALPVGISVQGGAALYGRLQRTGSGPFVLRGQVDFRDLELRPAESVTVRGINGEVPLSLALNQGASGLVFTEVPHSPEARGGGILPELLSERLGFLAGDAAGGSLGIERIDVPRISVEDIRTRAEIRGNRLLLDDFEARLLNGSLTGRIVAGYDEEVKVLLSLAARRLDFRKVIPPERLPAGAARDARPYLVNFDINATVGYPPASLEGEVQITRLGREVLAAGLDWVDPNNENPGIINIRETLERDGFLSPKSTSLQVNHGSGKILVQMQRNKPNLAEAKGWWQLLLAGAHLAVGGQMTFPVNNIPLGAMLGRIAQ